MFVACRKQKDPRQDTKNQVLVVRRRRSMHISDIYAENSAPGMSLPSPLVLLAAITTSIALWALMVWGALALLRAPLLCSFLERDQARLQILAATFK